MPKTPIKTIQFTDKTFKTRKEFLNYIEKFVIRFALENQALFNAMGYDAECFHKAKDSTTNTKVVIHSLLKDNILTIRAYTKKGIETLEFWYKLFKKNYPEKCKNVIESTECFEFKKTDKPVYYTSYNCAPFENVLYKNNTFHLNKIPNIITNKGFKEQVLKNLKGRLLKTFLNIDNSDICEISHFEISNTYKKVIAFSTKPRTESKKILEQVVFKITIAVNVQLPSYFSLGHRVAYGLGVFERDYSKQIHYENKNLNLKSNKKE